MLEGQLGSSVTNGVVAPTGAESPLRSANLRFLGCLFLAVSAFLHVVAAGSVSLESTSGEASPLAYTDPRSTNPSRLRVENISADPRAVHVVRVRGRDAVAANAAEPISDLPNPSAKPFILRNGTEADRSNASACLTSAIYYEAAIEPEEGQRAVAQVVLNRVRHPAWPNSVCGVVFEGAERVTGCQFTFTCDGALRRNPHPALWERARRIADEALTGHVFAPVGMSTHYHTNWIVPYWAASLVKAQVVGTHIFYRWTGGWGRPRAFHSRYAEAEPILPPMKWLSARVDRMGRPTLVGSAFASAATPTADVGPLVLPQEATDTSTALSVEQPAQVRVTATAMPEPPQVMIERMEQLCRRKRRCVKKQIGKMQQVFAALTSAPGDPSWHQCVSAAGRGPLTDWVAASRCLEVAGRKPLSKVRQVGS